MVIQRTLSIIVLEDARLAIHGKMLIIMCFIGRFRNRNRICCHMLWGQLSVVSMKRV